MEEVNLAMRVVDHEPHAWFLFEEDGSYFLDANCSHSAFSYCYLIELLPDETSKYKNEGRSYLSVLAHNIHYSAPIAAGNGSIYKGRDVSSHYAEKAQAAIKKWRDSNGHA